MRDKKLRTAWRTLMAAMQQSGDFDLYPEEEMIIVNALWELESLRENRDKAIEYIENENLRIIDITKKIPELCDEELLEILRGNNE